MMAAEDMDIGKLHASESDLEESDGSTTTGLENTRSNAEERSKEEIAAEENTAVKRSKWLVYLALLAAATTVGAITYVLISQDEQMTFEAEESSDTGPSVSVAHARMYRRIRSAHQDLTLADPKYRTPSSFVLSSIPITVPSLRPANQVRGGIECRKEGRRCQELQYHHHLLRREQEHDMAVCYHSEL